jgi:mannose/fructose/N-acetylgalactosamine-specific phosphotransferase system component IID
MALTHLSFTDRVKLLWRGLFVQVFWNYQTMQGAGFLFALLPFLHRMEPDASKRRRLVSLSAGFMNTHPSLAPLAMGAMLRRMAGDEGVEEESWRAWRESLCGPLGTLGDALIWSGLKPLVFILGVTGVLLVDTPLHAFWVPLLLLILYNGPLLGFRFWEVHAGWQRGSDVLGALGTPFFARSNAWISRIGAGLFGLLLVVAFAKTSLFAPLAMVQFGVGFALLWISAYASWPPISPLIVAVGFVPVSAWIVQLISTMSR